MAILSSNLKLLAGIPSQKLLEQATSLVLEPLLPFGIRVSEGPVLSNKTGLAPLHEFIVDRPNFSARGRKKSEALFNWQNISRTYPPVTGYIKTFINHDAIDVELMLAALIKTSKLLVAPIAYLDVHDNDTGMRERSNEHRDLYQEGAVGVERVFGEFRGLSGIPWKTILGPTLVEYFGVDKLIKLPSDLANEIAEGYWLLTPCEDYQDWTSERWCDGEAEIISILGVESFFNPETKVLPTQAPIIPKHSSLPIKVREKIGDSTEWEWLYLNGYQKPE